MTEKEFEQLNKEGKIKEEKTFKEPDLSKETKPTIEDFENILELLRQIKRHRTTAPTNIPRNFLEQIEFYDDGTNIRLYLYVNKGWHYASLT